MLEKRRVPAEVTPPAKATTRDAHHIEPDYPAVRPTNRGRLNFQEDRNGDDSKRHQAVHPLVQELSRSQPAALSLVRARHLRRLSNAELRYTDKGADNHAEPGEYRHQDIS
jgi:hypothetical protein